MLRSLIALLDHLHGLEQTASAISQLQPTNGTEGVHSNSSENFTLQVGNRYRLVINKILFFKKQLKATNFNWLDLDFTSSQKVLWPTSCWCTQQICSHSQQAPSTHFLIKS